MRFLGLRRHDLLLVAAGAAALLGAGVVVVKVVIDTEMERVCTRAQTDFPGERLLALVSLAQSPHHSLALRNRAVWALGQIGDARAIQPLEGLLAGGPCDHEHSVCQHEVRKALSLCRQPPLPVRVRTLLRKLVPGEAQMSTVRTP